MAADEFFLVNQSLTNGIFFLKLLLIEVIIIPLSNDFPVLECPITEKIEYFYSRVINWLFKDAVNMRLYDT
jgi:hypothetical protein